MDMPHFKILQGQRNGCIKMKIKRKYQIWIWTTVEMEDKGRTGVG
jgi:hypothetical protein